MSTWRDLAIGAALLAGVLAVPYSNIVFQGETLVSSANYAILDDRLTHHSPGSTSGPAFGNWHDQGAVWWQWEPAGQFFGRHYRRGIVPMWDPTIAGGVDTHVNVVQAQYFLPYVLVLLAGNTPLLRDLYHLLLLLVSGIACFALLRRNGFHCISAVFMGAAYMLSGAMTQNISSPIGQAIAVLPLMILAIDVLLDRLTWRTLGAAVLVVGLGAYASFLPVVISGFVLIAIQAVAYALSPVERWPQRPLRIPVAQVAAFSVAVIVALALLAFMLLPVAVAHRGNEFFATWYTDLGKMHYPLDLLPTLLSPRLFYDVYQTFPAAAAVIPKPQPWTSHFFYVGFLVVLLLPLVQRDQRPRVRRMGLFFALASALFFLKLMGVPPVQWVAFLPVFNLLHFIPYFCGAFTLALVGLAACAVESLVRSGVGRYRWPAVAVLGGMVLAAVPFFAFVQGISPAASADARAGYALELVRIIAVVAGILVVVQRRRRATIGGPLAGLLVVVLLAVELMPIAFHHRYLRSDTWNDLPRYVEFLRQEPGLFRIHSVQELPLRANVFQGVGVAGIASLGVFNQPRYTALIKKYFATETNSSFILPSSLLPSSRIVLDMLNVKYVVTHQPTAEQRTALRDAGFSEALVDGNFVVFRNPRVWPRAFVAHGFRVVDDGKAAVAALAGLETPGTVIVEQRPTFASQSLPASAATVTAYEPNQVTIAGETAQPGMLVLLDAFGSGWSATVNRIPSRVVPADAAFRGVEVPAGRWEVILRYSNVDASIGLRVSLLALVLALVALFLPGRLPGSSAQSAPGTP